MKLKVISGGQTGADVAGLWAAKAFGIPTGGWAPRGFLTTKGSQPDMKHTFGMEEHFGGYRNRTIENIEDSDYTIICLNKMSAGSRLTAGQCSAKNKDHCVIRFNNDAIEQSLYNPHFKKVLGYIQAAETMRGADEEFVLNIAGNSTKTSSNAFEFTFKFCTMLFSELGYKPTVHLPLFEQQKDRFSIQHA